MPLVVRSINSDLFSARIESVRWERQLIVPTRIRDGTRAAAMPHTGMGEAAAAENTVTLDAYP